jgi:hypothetical protein
MWIIVLSQVLGRSCELCGTFVCRHKGTCADAWVGTCKDGIKDFGFVGGGWMELAKD